VIPVSSASNRVSLIVLCALALGGCSSGTGTHSSSGPTTTAARQAPSPTASPSPPEAPLPSGPKDPNGVPIAWWPDACQVLQKSAVMQAFPGEAFADPQPASGRVGESPLPLPISCHYEAVSPQLGAGIDESVGPISTTVPDARRMFESGNNIGCDKPTPLPGMADMAVSCQLPDGVRIRALKGHVGFETEVRLDGTVTSNAPDRSAKALGAATALTKVAADRING